MGSMVILIPVIAIIVILLIASFIFKVIGFGFKLITHPKWLLMALLVCMVLMSMAVTP